MASLKASLPRLTSGSASIVELNPSEEYVKPLSQEINATPHTPSDATIKLTTDWCD